MHSQHNNGAGKPIKKILQEHKYNAIIGDPESLVGHDLLRFKY
jgi:hypothetical protein